MVLNKKSKDTSTKRVKRLRYDENKKQKHKLGGRPDGKSGDRPSGKLSGKPNGKPGSGKQSDRSRGKSGGPQQFKKLYIKHCFC
ncbi:hypothetical protein HCN44_002107 [Aphidius gifuensis]|uniref:Uncharacterized protein n=1 Tax=Aphidius gifuensis TaxID=684658 RepID=A0A834Y206_APHGI|nr:hypothetical protein HCN44_002107 [Aphidius gifuensis]